MRHRACDERCGSLIDALPGRLCRSCRARKLRCHLPRQRRLSVPRRIVTSSRPWRASDRRQRRTPHAPPRLRHRPPPPRRRPSALSPRPPRPLPCGRGRAGPTPPSASVSRRPNAAPSTSRTAMGCATPPRARSAVTSSCRWLCATSAGWMPRAAGPRRPRGMAWRMKAASSPVPRRRRQRCRPSSRGGGHPRPRRHVGGGGEDHHRAGRVAHRPDRGCAGRRGASARGGDAGAIPRAAAQHAGCRTDAGAAQCL